MQPEIGNYWSVNFGLDMLGTGNVLEFIVIIEGVCSLGCFRTLKSGSSHTNIYIYTPTHAHR